jgi:hypothetical protein
VLPKNLNDPIEKIVAEALEETGEYYIHESQNNEITKGLDFFLPESGIYIECKAYSSDRTARQLADKDNVVLLQGRGAAEFFARKMVAAYMARNIILPMLEGAGESDD